MKIDRIFSQRSLRPAGSAFDRGGPDDITGAREGAQAEGAALDRAFARENAAAERHTQALVAKGQADAELGQVISGAGRDLTEIAVQVQERRNKRVAETEFRNAKSEFDELRTLAEDHAGQGAPDGSDYEARYAEKFAEGQEGLLSKITNPDAKRLALAHGGGVQRAGARQVRANQARRETDWARQQLDIRTARKQKTIAARRGPEQERVLAEAYSDFDTQQKLGTITNAEKRKAALRIWAQDKTISVDANADALNTQAIFEAGGYDHLFANDFEKAAAADTIDKALKTQRAVEMVELDGLIKDDIASREATGQGVPGIRQRIANLGSEKALAAYDEQRAQADVYFATLRDIRYVPPQDALATVMASKPEPGAEGFAFNRKLHLAAVKALQARQKALADDPAAYAASNPAIKTREQNIALQKIMGVVDYSFFPKAEASAWVAKYEQAPDDGKIDLLAALIGQAGDHGRAAMEDLIEAKLPPSATVLMMHAGDNLMRPVLARTLEAETVGRKELEKGFEATVITGLKTSVRESLAAFRGSALAGGPGGAALANQAQDSVTLLALTYMSGGMDEAAAAEKAANDLFDDHFTYQGGYRVPKAYDAGAVAGYADWLLQNGLENADPGIIDPRFAEDVQRAQWLETVRERGKWINTPDGEGLVLVTDEGVPVFTRLGAPLTLDFADAEEGWREVALSPDGTAATGRFLGNLVQ